jgi:hypothetical protein
VHRLVLFAILMMLLAACAPTPTPTPVPTPAPTSPAVVLVTPTPLPPTATPVPPTATPTPLLPTATSTSTATSTPEPTDTPTPVPPTPTLTPMPTFTLSGIIFFDYNGNGVHDAHEPPIPGATVQVGAFVATSGEDGSYTLQGVPQGQGQVKLAAEGFRYISLSLEAFQAIEEPVELAVGGDVQRDLGLMEGFLTLPMPCGVEYQISNFFDHDSSRCPEGVDPHDANRCPNFRDWKGGKQTYDGEGGMDFRISLNTPVLAAAPGIVIKIDYDDAAGNFVILDHSCGIVSRYHHLNTANISLHQRVKRGDVIAFSGQTGDASHPHVHFEIRVNNIHRDPYRYLLDPNSESYWTKDNDPQCVE